MGIVFRFGVTKSRDGVTCPVSFPDQRKRYIQFVHIDSDGEGHVQAQASTV